MLTELAFRKHRLRVLGDERDMALLADIEQLRQEIAAQRSEMEETSAPA